MHPYTWLDGCPHTLCESGEIWLLRDMTAGVPPQSSEHTWHGQMVPSRGSVAVWGRSIASALQTGQGPSSKWYDLAQCWEAGCLRD
jgi:hypothetical protein